MHRLTGTGLVVAGALSAAFLAGCNDKKKPEMQEPSASPAAEPQPEYFASDPAGGAPADGAGAMSGTYQGPALNKSTSGATAGTSGSSYGASTYEAPAEPVSPPPSKPAKASSKGGATVHKVVKGDTLEKIAKKYYNNRSRWREIAKANHIADPKKIRPGQELVIP